MKRPTKIIKAAKHPRLIGGMTKRYTSADGHLLEVDQPVLLAYDHVMLYLHWLPQHSEMFVVAGVFTEEGEPSALVYCAMCHERHTFPTKHLAIATQERLDLQRRAMEWLPRFKIGDRVLPNSGKEFIYVRLPRDPAEGDGETKRVHGHEVSDLQWTIRMIALNIQCIATVECRDKDNMRVLLSPITHLLPALLPTLPRKSILPIPGLLIEAPKK